MPIPAPSPDESEDDFIGRCMGDPSMVSDFSDTDQRYAICISSFREKDQKSVNTEYLSIDAEIKTMDGDQEKGQFTGYGSVFGNLDLGNDIVMPGAFAKSIAQKGARGVKMLYQHKSDEPIGVYDEITEDKKGLKVKGRLAMGTQRGREVYELMKMGALSGLSIGFRVSNKGFSYEDNGRKRLLKDVDLMEISAVTFPMNTRATVQSVKGNNRTVREWEELLRDVAGLSRSQSKMTATAIIKSLKQWDAENAKDSTLVTEINKLINIIKN
jgi:HK97 family phage prohead protease